MKKKLIALTSFALAAALLLSACSNPRAAAPGHWYAPWTWGDQTLAQSLETGCVGGATSTMVAGSIYPCPAAGTPPIDAAPAPTAPEEPSAENLLVAGKWTPWELGNLVIEQAIQVRPGRPFEGNIRPVDGAVYQLLTDYRNEDATTWVPGLHLYEYDLPSGWSAEYVGAQGDTNVTVCLMAEKGAEGSQILMKTEKGNGASALVRLWHTGQNPPADVVCP